MHLEAEKLNGVVAALRMKGGDKSWSERRAFRRIPLQKCLAIIPWRAGVAGEAVNVWVRDVSAGGIGLVYWQTMREGDQFVIRLPLIDGSELPMLCSVAHCSDLAPDLFSIGATFVDILAADSAPPMTK